MHEVKSWTEEDLKNKLILPFFENRDFDLLDMDFEKSFKVTVGTKKLTVRSDILLKIKGHPILVVEIKKPRHKITQADVDQAISYARLCETIVPFAMVTSFEETKLYDTYTKSEVSSIPSYLQSVRVSEKLRLGDEIKFEALKTLFRSNYEFLLDFCQVQRKTQMIHLLNIKRGIGKFATELYVRRMDVERRFREFLSSKDQCFALIAEQGTGKTFSMITLAEKYGEKQPCLFFDSTFVPNTLKDMIEEDFGWGRQRKPWIGDILVQVDEISKKHNTQMLIFVDAINEPIPMRSRKVDIINLIRRLSGTSIKLILACRTQDWKFFSMDKGEPGVISWTTHMPPSKKTISTHFGESTSLGSCRLTNFSNGELDLAFLKYKEVFGLKSGLTKEARELCKHPGTLRIVSEVYSHNVIPHSLRRRKILEKFWRKNVEAVENTNIAEHLLRTIGHLILKNKTPEIKESSLIKSTNWNDIYQRAYEQMVSENILLVRRDFSGNMYLRILPNILMEYLVAKLLLEKYQNISPESVVANAESITENFGDFAPINRILLLYSTLIHNPPELVSYLLGKLDAENVINQVLDENPEVFDTILSVFKNKLIGVLSKEDDLDKLIRIIIRLLRTEKDQAKKLTIELILSPKFRNNRIRFCHFIEFIFKRSKSDEVFLDLPSRLFVKLKEKGQREFVDFLYRLYSVNPKIAKKILVSFKIGELRHLITSPLDSKEAGRSLYLLSKIHPKIISRIEPTGKILQTFDKELKAGKIKRPKPLKVSVKVSKIAQLGETIFQILLEHPCGLTWRPISEAIGIDKYKVLGTLEILVNKGIISREIKKGNGYTYEMPQRPPSAEVPLKYKPHKPPFAEYKLSMKEFTEKIISSDFDLTSEDIDKVIEEMMLGRYLRDFRSTSEFCYEVFGCSIDFAKEKELNTLEIPGKTFCFLVEWLESLEGFRKPLAKRIVERMSESAPKMFKNMILGIRARPRAKGLPVEIKNLREFEQRLKEFSMFFGEVGVHVPKKQTVFMECLESLKQRTEDIELLTSIKTIEFVNRLKDIFKEKSTELVPFESKMATVIIQPVYISRQKILSKDASEILSGIADTILKSTIPEKISSIEVKKSHIILTKDDETKLLVHYTEIPPREDALLTLRCWSTNKDDAERTVSEISEIIEDFSNTSS